MALERIGLKSVGKIFQKVETENDMDDFKMPYQFYGKVELEIMVDKYKRLNNDSKGLHVRYGRKLKI